MLESHEQVQSTSEEPIRPGSIQMQGSYLVGNVQLGELEMLLPLCVRSVVVR